MKKFRFREFQVYKDARSLRKLIKTYTRTHFPKEEQFCLTSQLWRALDSIILNIAEGSDRGTDRDFAHFLNTAHTSLNEVIACLDSAIDDGYLHEDQLKEFLEESEKLANQLTAFRKSLLISPSK